MIERTPSLRLASLTMSLVLLGLIATLYAPAMHGTLLWDDAAHVTRPELSSWSGLGRIWCDLHATQQYYPVLHSAFWFEHRLWEESPLGYHLLNVFLHAAACTLFALAVIRLAPDLDEPLARWSAGWLAALLLAVHPVSVESVAWISEQKNTLSLVFYLLAGLLYLRFHDTRQPLAYALATGCFLLALGSKSVTATLPAALLVVLWWREGKLRGRRDVWPLLPWFLASIAAGLFTAWVERTLIGASGSAFALSFGQRVLLASRSFWFYAGKLIWPHPLIFIYPRWDVSIEAKNWMTWTVATIAFTAGLWGWRKSARGPLAAWLFFAGSLFPALGFFNLYPFRFSYVADHFQYVASLGFYAAVANGFVTLVRRTKGGRRMIFIAVGAATVSALAVETHRLSADYQASETLYRATLARNPDCAMAHTNLAVELEHSPARVSEALVHLEEAVRLRPDYPEAHNNLGNALMNQPGRQNEAIAQFEAALRLEPRFPEARLNLANAWAGLPAKWPEALALYEETLRAESGLADLHYCYANLLAKIPGRGPQAREEYEKALQLRPNYIEAHVNLAELLLRDPERREEALRHFESALRLNPREAKTHFSFASALDTIPIKENEARAQYEETLRLEPTYAAAHNNLGIWFARHGQYTLARREWEAALKLKPEYAEPRRNLEQLDQLERRDRP